MSSDDERESVLLDLVLRPIQSNDMAFLSQLYASTRADEVAQIIDWTEEQKDTFLRQQFQAQHDHYQQHYPRAQYDIIEKNGEQIGRLYVDRTENEIRVMDIALLPSYRNRGIGRALMQKIMDEAAAKWQYVSLHVEEMNPAKKLYDRMGFVVVGGVSFYKLMHWNPEGVISDYDSGRTG